MNTNALIYFLEIAKTGALNKAANNLFISQPALRSSISNLEKELGAPLLFRTKHGSELTEFGKKVAVEAPLLLEQIGEWKSYAAERLLSPEKIHIFSTKPFLNVVLMPIVAILQQQDSEYRFSLKSSTCYEAIDHLKKNDCQIAIIHADLVEPNVLQKQLHLDDSYVIEQIIVSRFFVLINKASPLNEKETLVRSDFDDYTYVNVSNLEIFTKNSFLKNGFNAKGRTLFCDSPQDIFQFINKNSNYYSLLTSIFEISENYKMYDHVQLRPVSDVDEKNAFYLIHPSFSSDSQLQQLCGEIKKYCDEISINLPV